MTNRAVRFLVVMVVAFASVTLLSEGVGASPYTSNGATVSSSNPDAGDSVTVTGGGFKPSSSVDVFLDDSTSALATGTADANGSVSVDLRVPDSLKSGTDHHLTVSGVAADGTPLTEEIGITVAGDAQDSGTGAWLWIVIVAAIVLAAVVLLWARRRRAPR